MSADRWHQVKSLFQQAIDTTPAQREAFLNRAAGDCGDPSVLTEVRRLVRIHERSPDKFLQTPIGEVADDRPSSGGRGGDPAGLMPSDPLIGQCIGGFRMLRRIGVGGMGAVYEAEQEHPHRRAAVKVLRQGFVTPRMLRRFEFEAEILAKLQHPGIAHVYAAGTFDFGDGAQPWFAMELIDGPPLNRIVNDRTFSIRHKLELLLRICDAVQHAHQRGVVHRDLKPANILVTGDASIPCPKILDFGVARVLDHSPDDVSAARWGERTVAGEIIGTLSYMSPEQVAGDPNRIDARCDVYALGVIGFEMLAGRLPHQRKSSSTPGLGSAGAVADLVAAIAEEEPTRLGRIHPSFRDELETIFAKALERDQDRRYQSAAELAADLRRYLNGEPVLARPATTMYQLRKFARRNRTLVGGVLATVAALAIGIVMAVVQAHQARLEAARSKYEADKAVAINNFITNDFLMKLIAAAGEHVVATTGQQPDGARAENPATDFRSRTAELVDQAAANIAAMFADQPLAEAAVRNEVGTIYYNLGAFDHAAEQFDAALRRWESELGPDHPDTLKAVNNLGQTMARLGRADEAEALYRRALDGRTRVLGEDDPFTLVSMNNMANHYRFSGQLEQAEALFRRTLLAQRRVHGDEHKNTLITMANLGSVLIARGHIQEALDLHQQVYDTFRRTLGDDHVTTLTAGSRLGQTLHKADQDEKARELLLHVTNSFERTFGADNGETIVARSALARACHAMGKHDEAIAQWQAALQAARSRPQQFAKLINEIERDLDRASASPSTASD